MLNYKLKTIILGNINLIEYCNKEGIDLDILKKCRIETINKQFFFALQKENAPKMPEGYFGCDLRTQPDVVLIMDVDEAGNFYFEQTEHTVRILRYKVHGEDGL